MILKKLWRAIVARFNKWANAIRGRDPIAEMQYECDTATEQMKEGRRGLEQYRGLVERVTRQVATNKKQVEDLASQIRACLQKGDRTTAGSFAVQLHKAEQQLKENEDQLKLHEQNYENNLLKLQHAGKKINEVRQRIATYDATLRMSKAEAEIAKLSQSLQFDVTTDFGQIEQIVQDKIDQSRAEVRVAADLSSQGLDEIRREQEVERAQAEEVLRRFEEKELTPFPMLERRETVKEE